MKLIDADELMQKICSVKYLRKIKSKQLIDECERIDAIPINKLEEWQKQYGNKCTYGHIMKLVEGWRKENESNISN